MANYNGFAHTNGTFGEKPDRLNGGQLLPASKAAELGSNFPGFYHHLAHGDKISKRMGKTITSPVTVVNVLQIAGPRVLPLEIAWKKAAADN